MHAEISVYNRAGAPEVVEAMNRLRDRLEELAEADPCRVAEVRAQGASIILRSHPHEGVVLEVAFMNFDLMPEWEAAPLVHADHWRLTVSVTPLKWGSYRHSAPLPRALSAEEAIGLAWGELRAFWANPTYRDPEDARRPVPRASVPRPPIPPTGT